mmetsp:Transcript_40102/g.123895  ORF Transcript_40102/g.123895 Transcript_40102/m.123895 type:complete len:213 (-) Transcript_40102:1060-1698(-)
MGAAASDSPRTPRMCSVEKRVDTALKGFESLNCGSVSLRPPPLSTVRPVDKLERAVPGLLPGVALPPPAMVDMLLLVGTRGGVSGVARNTLISRAKTPFFAGVDGPAVAAPSRSPLSRLGTRAPKSSSIVLPLRCRSCRGATSAVTLISSVVPGVSGSKDDVSVPVPGVKAMGVVGFRFDVPISVHTSLLHVTAPPPDTSATTASGTPPWTP